MRTACSRIDQRAHECDFGEKTGLKFQCHDLIFAEPLDVLVLFLVHVQTVVNGPFWVANNIAEAHPLEVADPIILHIVVDVSDEDAAAHVPERQNLVVAQSVQNLSEHCCCVVDKVVVSNL